MDQIRFRCIRCQHPLKAGTGAVGKKLHCPVCYYELTVPTESTNKPVDPSQLYAADDKPADVREMRSRHEFASLRCKVCSALIAVRKKEIGQEVACPDCETTLIVPPEIAQQVDAALNSTLDKIMLGLDTDAVPETYAVRDENVAPPEDWTGLIPVHCRLCHTLMHASDQQVGQELTCPDCGTNTVIKAVPKEKFVQPDVSGGSYSLSETAPPPPRPAFRTLTDYRYVEGSLDKEYHGDKPPEERNVRRTSRPASTDWDDGSTSRIDLETIRQRARQKKKKTSNEDRRPMTVRRSLPKRPLTEGLLTPLLDWRVPVRLLFFAGIAWSSLLLVSLMPGFLISLSIPVAGLFILVWASLQTNYCWNVFQFSTDGNDDFDEAAEFSFIGSLGLGFWMVCCSILAAVPGQFFASCLPGELFIEQLTADGRTVWNVDSMVAVRNYILLRLSHWILFPFFFLSCMEAGSYFSLISWRTFRTLARHTGIWVRFYGLAALLILLPEFAFAGCFFLVSRFQDGTALTIPFYLVGFLFFNVFSLLFFRLLGRFAWVLEESVRQERDEEDEEEW